MGTSIERLGLPGLDQSKPPQFRPSAVRAGIQGDSSPGLLSSGVTFFRGNAEPTVFRRSSGEGLLRRVECSHDRFLWKVKKICRGDRMRLHLLTGTPVFGLFLM